MKQLRKLQNWIKFCPSKPDATLLLVSRRRYKRTFNLLLTPHYLIPVKSLGRLKKSVPDERLIQFWTFIPKPLLVLGVEKFPKTAWREKIQMAAIFHLILNLNLRHLRIFFTFLFFLWGLPLDWGSESSEIWRPFGFFLVTLFSETSQYLRPKVVLG